MTNAPWWKLYDDLIAIILLPRSVAFSVAGILLVVVMLLRLTAKWLQQQHRRGAHLSRDQREGADV